MLKFYPKNLHTEEFQGFQISISSKATYFSIPISFISFYFILFYFLFFCVYRAVFRFETCRTAGQLLYISGRRHELQIVSNHWNNDHRKWAFVKALYGVTFQKRAGLENETSFSSHCWIFLNFLQAAWNFTNKSQLIK